MLDPCSTPEVNREYHIMYVIMSKKTCLITLSPFEINSVINPISVHLKLSRNMRKQCFPCFPVEAISRYALLTWKLTWKLLKWYHPGNKRVEQSLGHPWIVCPHALLQTKLLLCVCYSSPSLFAWKSAAVRQNCGNRLLQREEAPSVWITPFFWKITTERL